MRRGGKVRREREGGGSKRHEEERQVGREREREIDRESVCVTEQ